MGKKKSSKKRTTSKKTATKKATRKKSSSRAADAAHGDAFPIVGIGASAGGLDALRRLLEAMPDEPGLALVVIQHLDPTKKSLAPELLAKYTTMQVAQIEGDPHVTPNHVYVIPPDKYLSIAANEEVMSMNEELQSTNEELETSKEELQSLNEELSTVNSQLASKIEELETKHNDLSNLLQVTHLATICLDNKLKVRWFSQQAAALIRVTSADIGRPVSDFAHDFLNGDITEVAQRVLDHLVPEEREVAASNNRWFLRRTTPYRSEDNRIGGIVITYIDISERKRAEEVLRESHALSEKIIDTVREATLVLDSHLRVVSANESFFRTFEVSYHETEGRLVYELGNSQWDIPELRRLLEKVLPQHKTFNDFEVDHEFESIGRRVMLLNGRQIDHIQMILLAIEDITDLRMAEHRRGFLLELSDTFRSTRDPQSIVREATSRLCRFLNCGRALLLRLDGGVGFQPAEHASKSQQRQAGSLTHATIVAQYSEGQKDLQEPFPLADLGPRGLALLKRNKDLIVSDMFQDSRFKGTSPNVMSEMGIRSLVAVPRLNNGGLESLLLVARSIRRTWNREEIGLIRDVAERAWSSLAAVTTERALRESEERVRLATEGAQIGIWEWDLQTDQAAWDKCERELLGLEQAPMSAPVSVFFERVHPYDLPKLRRALDAAIEHNEPYDHEFRVIRADGRTRWLAGKGEVFCDATGKPIRMRGVNFDVTQRKQLESELKEVTESLEQQVSQRTEMLKLLQDVTRAANEARTVEEAMQAAMQRIAQYNGWQVGHVWRVADDGSGRLVSSQIWHATEKAERAIARLDEFRQICEQIQFEPGELLVGAVAQSGRPQWIDDITKTNDWRCGDAAHLGLHAVIAFPVTVNGTVVAVMEFFSDRPAKREERFMEIMPDVGIQVGHVIERKRLEKDIADTAEREQRRIGGDIHDGVGQELTGLRYLAHTHAETLTRQASSEVRVAQRIVEGFETIQQQLRAVIRDLVPVELDEEGLVAALRSLAERTGQTYDVACDFECEELIAVEDNLLATHVYRIGQEAVYNAVRHARAGRITIRLDENNGELNVQIVDDGVGIGPEPFQHAGLGIRSMRFRADLIGAHLTIQAGEEGGTMVQCKVPIRHA